MMKLRIATYNIHKGVSSIGGRPRVQALKQAIGELDADIVFLQEVQGRDDLRAARFSANWPEQPQHDYLAGDSHHVAYGMNAVYDHGHHGNALLSKFPIVTSRNQDVSDHAYESRGILHCVIDTPAGPLHCYVIHLGLFARSRRRQSAALIEAVQAYSPGDCPIVIAGDFNDWTNELSDTLREKIGVTEVFDANLPSRGFGTYLRLLSGRGPKIKPARTFPSALPWLRLDRIYVRGLKVDSAQVLHGGLWARLSDHAPIVAELTLDMPAAATGTR